MPLIRELIDIPERVQRGDFVLNLATGLEADAVTQTLRDYVVTPQLAHCFDDALAFIHSAVDGGQKRNKGAYLHGSFGSGKSHFMAVLHLLLQGNPQARAIPELAGAIAKHDAWLSRSHILLVPYHLIGAPSLEAGILGGYARHIAKRHPEAPIPGFFLAEPLLRDAQAMRRHMGDDAFFAALNATAQGDRDQDNPWGDVATGWDAHSFDAVLAGQTGEMDRAALTSALVGSLFQAYATMVNADDGGYVEFDEGLRIMTQHAKTLGYNAIVLFLDELILWLVSKLSDRAFISREVQKIVKLVETGIPRELPLVSFIARQRDLREFVGDQYSGVEQEILSDSLKYWEGRFHTITLEDRNLPVIAQKRLLRPKNEAARQQIEHAFATTQKMREDAFEVLLTGQGDRAMFRQLYPFSPALVQALVALSSALQRERTALRAMLMLLVEQRDTLELGQLIPAGDLFDVLQSGAEPFSAQMKQQFENAQRLLNRKFIPLLEAEHGLSADPQAPAPADNAQRRAFANDLRLIKTLLLAALAPEVESLKQLTASKLAALNHGTIRSPIPGRETQTVLLKCSKWAGQVGELKLSEDPSPLISLQLSGIDTESILQNARASDNEGNRKRLVRDMASQAFGIADAGQLFVEHPWTWRGTARSVDVVFQNVREIQDDSIFEARGDHWKIIIDFPFDSDTYSPTDDQARIRDYQARGGQSRTLCWLPHFLSPEVQKNLGRLVILQEILKSDDSYSRYTSHLTPQDRASARALLDNQRSQLRQQLNNALLGAYGVATAAAGTLDNEDLLQSPIISLQPGFNPGLPHGTTMARALEQLLDQALSFQYPDHPPFEGTLRDGDLDKVLKEIRRAIHAENGRIEVDTSLRRPLRDIAQPLELGTMHERHFIYRDDWCKHLTREVAKTGHGTTIAALRAAMDQPQPRGLTPSVQNLLILIYAEAEQSAFTRGERTVAEVSLKHLPDDLVLVRQALAEAPVWRRALDNAGALFGIALPNTLRTAHNQKQLQDQLKPQLQRHRPGCNTLLATLTAKLQALGVSGEVDRLATARVAAALLDDLGGREGLELVEGLAEVQPATSLQALGRSMATATRIAEALEESNWPLLERVWRQGDGAGESIRQDLHNALAADELVTPLVDALKCAERTATQLLAPEPLPPAAPAPPPPPAAKGKIIRREARQGLDAQQAEQLLAELRQSLGPGITLDIHYTLTDQSNSHRP